MNTVISDFILHNKHISEFLELASQKRDQADTFHQDFLQLLADTRYNTALGTAFATHLQCLNDEDIIGECNLPDISRLFDSLMKTQPANLEHCVEAAHFEWAVMDDLEKALDIIAKGLEEAGKRTEELRKLLQEITAET